MEAARCRKWRIANRDRVLKRLKEYRVSNLERIRKRERDRKREKYQEQRSILLARQKAWRKSHPEIMRELHRKRWSEHKEQLQHYFKERRQRLSLDPNWKEKELQRHREAYSTNKAAKLSQNKKWRDRQKHYYAARSQHRRALKKKGGVNLKGIMKWMKSVRSSEFSTCYYCTRLVSSKIVHFDHIVPLSRGGEHSVANLCVSCPDCNLSKGFKSIRTWIRVGQQILEV